MSVLAAAVSALLFSIYTGIATTAPSGNGSGIAALFDRLSNLGSVNLLALGGLLALVAQAVLTEAGTQSRRLRQQAEGEQLTEALLEGVNGLLHAQNPGPIYRSLVAIADRKRGVRTSIVGANIRTDPEFNLSKPIDFGVAGEAFMTRSVRAADLDDSNRDLGRDGSRVPGIWRETSCVLAYPLIDSRHRAYGTLNFDSNVSLAVGHLGERAVQDAIGHIAGVVNYLMRHHSASGEAPLPR
ncbi:hypothetical protein [Streptomyces antibioticus]|uniref:hypothetical protein n=1 Tax=Streptomyces antibioticus TaxID=1890 RepID=UPI003D70EFDD